MSIPSFSFQSQHLDSIKLYYKLHNHHILCDETLGVKFLDNLKGASPGAGGALLLSAVMDGELVVIKVFQEDCPYKYLKGVQRSNVSAIRDYGDFEPGTGLLFTNIFILPSITQNITTCYNVSVCNPAYRSDVSLCTRKPLQNISSYPMPTEEYCENNVNPLCVMNSMYHRINTQGPYEIPARSDIVRFMMVEKCPGDIQGLIETSGSITNQNIDHILYPMILMVLHCLLLFDCILDGYTHKDLGARNVLYTYKNLNADNRYWRYNFPSGSGTLSIDIPENSLIPKIWDFAFPRFGNASNYRQFYEYLSSPAVPDFTTIVGDERQNDVYILINDIVNLMNINGIIGSMFQNTNIDDLKLYHNNTAAVYAFLNKFPIPTTLLANSAHEIVHTFPPDISVFDTFDINRKVV